MHAELQPDNFPFVGGSNAGELPHLRFGGSWFALVLAWVTLVAAAILGFQGRGARAAVTPTDPAVCDAARGWRATYGHSPDLQILVTQVTFHGTAGEFVSGEGVVIAPAAVALPGAQEVLDVRGIPDPVRMIEHDGIRMLAWPYPGSLHRDFRFVGLSLVRRPPSRPVMPPDEPTFDTLAEDARFDARLTSAELEESHNLAACSAFRPWVKETAGDPPYTEQMLRVGRRLGLSINRSEAPKKKGRNDLCAALRENALNDHEAQIVAVMTARELGVPAYGLLAADVHYLVGIFVDGPGWITLDTTDFYRGFQSGGVALVTKAPVVGRFDASRDGFWLPEGAMYEPTMAGRGQSRSSAHWGAQEGRDDATVTYAIALDEACP
jgi:hypothetical protein